MVTQSNTWSFIIKTLIYSIILFLSISVTQANDDYSLIGLSDLSDYTDEQLDDTSTNDPLEKVNRKIFKFNEKIDKVILKPVAKGYRKIVPSLVRQSVHNVFSHVDDLFVISNDALQAKPKQTLQDTARFVFNSTFGVLGLFDVATSMGLPKHNEDFGQTMGKWGLKSGPYIMLPILGPGSVRSFAGDVAHYAAANNATIDKNYVLNPAKNLSHSADRNGITALRLIDKRESLLDAEEILDDIVIDRYSAVRDAYLQNREYLTNDEDTSDDDIEISNDDDLLQ